MPPLSSFLPTAYRLVTDLGAPFLRLYLWLRLVHGKEDPVRFAERLGKPSRPRPAGRLIWFHGASVGEAMSALSLIRKLREREPDTTLLVTTGTVSSARILATRLPEGVIHQYLPVDRQAYANSFLNHWRPDLILWIESDLWPNVLSEVKKQNIPAVLLNARLSDRSFRRWQKTPNWAQEILSTFFLILAQTAAIRDKMQRLGAPETRLIGNLKYATDPLPFDENKRFELKSQIGDRPFWLMASTHEGEDAIAAAVHRALQDSFPDLLTILVPRHAPRSDAIEKLLSEQNLSVARRSRHEAIRPETSVYLADTMGEMGLFYKLAPIVCVGGSFTWGGHNPVEPAQLGCAVLFGPLMTNFAEMAAEMLSAKAAQQVASPEALAATIKHLLSHAADRESLANRALAFAADKAPILDQTIEALSPWLGKKNP